MRHIEAGAADASAICTRPAAAAGPVDKNGTTIVSMPDYPLAGTDMKKNPVLLLVIGAAMLIVGVFLQLNGGPPKADAAAIAQCENRVRDQGAEMIARCQESAFATAMTATDAQAAAQSISAANNSEVGGNMLSLFLIGLSLPLLIVGVLGLVQRRRGV